MNKLFRSSLVASALTVTGIAATATSAFAGTGAVDFYGNVGQVCSFSNSQPGSLTRANYSPSVLYTSTPGSIFLHCNSGAVVSVSTPVDTGSTTVLTPIYFESVISSNQSGMYAVSNSDGYNYTANYSGSFQDTYQVDMYFQNGYDIPQGSYAYSVTVTATPQ